MKLEDLLAARRTMDYCATSFPKEVFELAKADYLVKLKNYQENETTNQDTMEQFSLSEQKRAEQLTLFNSTRSIDVNSGNNDEVRERTTSHRTKSPGI